MLGQFEQLLQSAYRCIGRYPYGSFIKSVFSLSAFGCMILAVCFGSGPRIAALAFASANITGTVILCILVRRDIPWIEYGWRHASFAEIRALARPAVAFMGFPIGNALSLQGSLLAVGYALGPTAVVIFGTARTVSRVALQMVSMVNSHLRTGDIDRLWREKLSAHPHSSAPRLPACADRRFRHRAGHDDVRPMVSSPLDRRPRTAQPRPARHLPVGRGPLRPLVDQFRPDDLDEPAREAGHLLRDRNQRSPASCVISSLAR